MSRHHRSGGFGIHSPFAYNFVRTVLRERTPYYAYEEISRLVRAVRQDTTRGERRELGMISERQARLLFRVTNFFNPQSVLQVGALTGIESVAMMAVSHESRLHLFDRRIERNVLALRVLQSRLDRVECYDDEDVAVDCFLTACGTHLALVNRPIAPSVLHRLLDNEIVVVLCRMDRDKPIAALLDSCRAHMTAGQTFSNGKMAILIPNPKLQREDFLLWL